MKKLFALLPLSLMLFAPFRSSAQPAGKPKLVVVIVVDQFRYDYLTRFRGEYTGGIAKLLESGAVFTNAQLEHFPTVTGIGHSVILTGAPPSVSGIVGNDWYDRESGGQVGCVSDSSCAALGGDGVAGASPRRMLVETVGDEMKLASGNKSRVIGISIKDRAAILTSGHLADAAYWFDDKTGEFVSSTYYFPELPGWAVDFNRGKPADKYKGADWMGRALPTDEKIYEELPDSPYGNELLEAFAERAIASERLGEGEATDLLSVSFSSNDYVGHRYGPYSPEVHDISVRTDRLLEKLFRFLDTRIGMRNVLVVFTADHGVAPVPQQGSGRRMPGGRMPPRIVQTTVQAALTQKYGEGKWILSPSEHSLYLDHDLIGRKGLSRDEVRRTAAEAALEIPHVMRVYTYQQLLLGAGADDRIGRRVMNSFSPRRAADVYLLLEPYWFFGSGGTTHGTAFDYDAHVPVIFMGAGIQKGSYNETIAVNDIAPTLSTLLGIETPSGSTGRALPEIVGPNQSVLP